MQTYLPKWEQKLPKIPIIVFQIQYKLINVENGGGRGVVTRNIWKFETKLSKSDAQKGNQNCPNPDKYPSNSLNT